MFLKSHLGYWEKIRDPYLASFISKLKFADEVNFTQVNSVISFIKMKTNVDSGFFDRDLARLLVCFNNSILEFNEDLGEFIEVDSPEDINLPTKIPHNYNLCAKAPEFQKFLYSITENDADQKEKLIFFMELIGMCLIAPVVFEKFFIFIGNGSNGKSIFMELITNIVGSRNVCSVTPEGLTNKFQRAHLYGKNVNVVTELPEGGELPTDSIKSTCSGELMTVENKNKDPFDFRPYCTIIFGSNFMPYSNDRSNGTMRRIEFIMFNQTFVDEVDYEQFFKKDPSVHVKDLKLANKLFAEIEGIIPLCLRAFGNAIVRGSLTKVSSSEESKEEWFKDCNQILQFIDDRCVIDKEVEISIADLYFSYERFVEDDGIKYKKTKNKFVRELLCISGIKRHRTSRERGLKGIGLKSDYRRE
ncbi:phage/plasmid primase, P4 family [bacterium]|nr:phage/plasmid primase, P4 family [bacterium]